MRSRSDLRAQVIGLSHGTCEWPGCRWPGVELAHLHSVGAGGRRSADTLDNVAWLCYRHARASDGLFENRTEYEEDLRALGVPVEPGSKGLGWLVAEALTAHVAVSRPPVEEEQ